MRRRITLSIAAVSAAAGLISLLTAGSAMAAGSQLYFYRFDSAHVSGTTIPNQAGGMYSTVALKLFALKSGDWKFANGNQGIQFSGNTTADQSVAYGRPASGDTIDIPNGDTIGAGVQFTFQSPTSATCSDTPNVGQVGRSGTAGEGQVKIQLSNCTAGQPTYVECRIAGKDSTVNGDKPVKLSSLPLVNGDQYNVTCTKSAGDSSGNANVKLTVEDVTAAATKNISGKRLIGDVINTNQFVSAGNKYGLPKLSQNTDQFNGILYTETFCQGSTVTNASSCVTGTFRTIS
jgi:hypothetical protein